MKRIYASLVKAEAVLAGFLLMAMVGLIFAGGIARMMRNPLNWTIDLATCFFAWAVFLCADIAWRNDKLMAVDLIGPRLPARGRHVLGTLNYAIICVFLGYVIYAGAWLSWVSRARSFQGIPGVSYSWVTMSLVVGGALLLATTLIKLARHLRGGATPAKGA
ncbi:TRAP transporter small permease [Salinarimonas ramus]|uniref:TRAP transporter small permease protein n=1 Tax=Salinarimonas ramus TaxID=690164 RepID=A0A917V2W1_9HYPH|nr:TRAP transporter small permease subunit [Salinarimonas ramus]GGK26586.1 C4-dicarboxylate ABC transporter [Salinarimonas ramus]